MENLTNRRELSNRLEVVMEYDRWCGEIPYINFPSDWEIKIIPPFYGAVVRFKVKKGDTDVSIYLDCYDHLGCVGKPYWEIYPVNGDVSRCAIQEVDYLLEAIALSIAQQNDPSLLEKFDEDF